LINNAGIGQRSYCLDTEMSVYRKIFDVDVLGQIALTKAVLPVMLNQRFGHIAVTSSIAGKIGVPYRTGYCAAKHAVLGFFDALRAELNDTGIKVTTILPGFVRTNISIAAMTGEGDEFGKTDKYIANGMDPDVCAAVIVKALKKGKAEFVVAGGPEKYTPWLKRFFPGLVMRWAAGIGKPE
jgi:short-subunit dehydrogenase